MDLHMQTEVVGTGFISTSANGAKEERGKPTGPPQRRILMYIHEYMCRTGIKTQGFGAG